MIAPDPPVHPVDEGPAGSVLDLLAPLRRSYTSRTLRTAGFPSPTEGAAQPLVDSEPCLIPCIVEGVITVDPEGRIPWRFRFDGLDTSSVGLALGDGGSFIEVSTEPIAEGPRRRRDRHGRLHLPHGLLRATGCWPGDRLAVARLRDRPRLVLVRADRLGIRPEPNEHRG